MRLLRLTLAFTLAIILLAEKSEENLQEDSEAYKQFEIWHSKYNKEYSLNSEEGRARFKTFIENRIKVEQHNKLVAEHNENSPTFLMELGPFADLAFKEFRKGLRRGGNQYSLNLLQ